MLAPSGGGLILYQAYGNLYAMTGRKAHLLEDKQISSVGVFDEVYFSFGRHLEELHVTWPHLEKKQTRLRAYTNIAEEFLYSGWRRRHKYNMTPSQRRSRQRHKIPRRQKVDSNVILDSPDMCDNDIQTDQNAKECDDERVALTNLIANLKLNIDENKKIRKQLKKANASLTQELKECKSNLEESNTTRDSFLIALQSKQTELETYKTLNDSTVDYEKLERKLNETLGLLAQKEIDIKEGLKLKAYEILVVKEKHDELVKQSFLTKSHYEGLVKEKTMVITDLKLKEEKDIDKIISMEKQLKFLNEIVYKRNQSIQTIHMLAPKGSTFNCRPTFANPMYLKKAQSEKPCLYEIPYDTSDPANRFVPDREETLTLEKEIRSKLNKDLVKSYDYTKQNSLYENFKPASQEYHDQLAHANELSRSFAKLEKHSISLELALQQCQEQIKNDTVCKEKASNVFLKEREQYFKIQDLKAQLQDMNIAISELKKLIDKCKGKSVETKFDKPSVVRQPNAQRIPKPSVLGKPTPFSDSLKRKSFSKTKSVPKTNVSEGLSKPVTTQILPQTARQAVRNTNVIKPGMYQINTRPTQTRAPQLPQTSRNTNPRVSTSTGVIHRTNVSRPQLRSTQMKDKVVPNNSQVKFKKTEVEDHHRISSISNKTKSVTACNDSLKSKTSNVNVVCATCEKCVFNSNHDACVSKFLNDVNARTKKPKVVPINTGNSITGLCNFVEKYLGTVRFGNDQFAPILGYGDLVQGNITINRVYYVEGLNHNLFSVGQFCDADLEVAFWKSTCFVRDLQGMLLTGNRGTDLYTIFSSHENNFIYQSVSGSKASPTQAWLWHQRLSHLNFDYINLLLKKDVVIGLPKLKFDEFNAVVRESVANDTSGLVPQRQKASDYDNPDPAPELQNVSPSIDATGNLPILRYKKLLSLPHATGNSNVLYFKINLHRFRDRGQKDHPLTQVRGNPSKPVQTSDNCNDPECVCSQLHVSIVEPKNIKEAMVDSAWIEAIQEELHQFDRLQVWELVDKPFGKNEEVIDFENLLLSCSLGRLSRFFVAYAAHKFIDPDHPEKVYRLRKALYGLKQAPRAWYDELSKFLISKGFTKVILSTQSASYETVSWYDLIPYNILFHDDSEVYGGKGRMPTKIELTLEQSQQGVSNDVLVSIEGVEELKRNVWIKGLRKQALHTTYGTGELGRY
ncbi:retrovirus-related pol polyprotein from transposon TNT 1-94 [Tanacetum coccineum]|uniref:Retrovirus-related pol polyprotein from transposon TNT 1-94 n=1 Tax=Tanacetum coccineum TaxID=301880 RepID=A0ABQ5ED88_9ASTR